MRSFKVSSVIVFSILLVFFAGTVVSADTRAPISYASAVKIAAPSVLNVKTIRKTQLYRHTPNQHRSVMPRSHQMVVPGYRTRSTLGSGVIIEKKGYVLTNYHVVRNAKKILIALADGRKTEAKLIGSDPETDLAVLQILLSDLHPAKLGNSDALHVGDVVLAIGNPFGLGQTVTQGIISAIGRSTVGINQLENYIQTDAAINPGNSGGALIDTEGRVIGINTGIYSKSGGYQGVGFAIPINVALNVMQQIIKTGYVKRGWLGVRIRTLSIEIAKRMKLKRSTGVVIIGLAPKSPAAKAGVKVGDVITYINTQRVSSARGFLNYIAQRKPGSSVTLTLWRKQREQKISVSIGKRPPPPVLDDRGRPPSRPDYVPDQRSRPQERWY